MISGYDSLETKVIEAMNSVDCEHGFVNAVKVDTTKSDSRISVTCVYTKDALGSFEDGVLESSGTLDIYNNFVNEAIKYKTVVSDKICKVYT